MSESHILKHEYDRTDGFRPNHRLVDLINRIKPMLEPLQQKNNRNFSASNYPVVVVLGCPRSGTTILTQILAATGDFAYPTNFLSRFAYAPQIGAMIQQMLFDPAFDYRGEFSDIQSLSGFSSNLGKTSGALGINEFFHFWRKFFPNHDPGHLTNVELKQVDIKRMRSELESIESVLDKPFMSKGLMLQYNIRFFAEKVPELFFIHIKRQPRFVMQSILQSRRKFYGRDDIWWSVKPKEYQWLSSIDPIRQVAGQVLFTEKAIDDQLDEVEEYRKLVYQYEDLCTDPKEFYYSLRTKFKKVGFQLKEYDLEESFPCGNIAKIDEVELYQLESAYNELLSGLVNCER